MTAERGQKSDPALRRSGDVRLRAAAPPRWVITRSLSRGFDLGILGRSRAQAGPITSTVGPITSTVTSPIDRVGRSLGWAQFDVL